jgi:hypothetical protein
VDSGASHVMGRRSRSRSIVSRSRVEPVSVNGRKDYEVSDSSAGMIGLSIGRRVWRLGALSEDVDSGSDAPSARQQGNRETFFFTVVRPARLPNCGGKHERINLRILYVGDARPTVRAAGELLIGAMAELWAGFSPVEFARHLQVLERRGVHLKRHHLPLAG